ncbi:uncharacterized protein LOC110023608 [Phalaenopsis equestris]|uniref:uncharacterized protein LOC110023608 n=1 Tax=Phalaenopsis equestris TaxID=78828 RepID=UPI0009E494E8|nr:uncharacterized protein LOC110023608 [Phalaenopsis equestris]
MEWWRRMVQKKARVSVTANESSKKEGNNPSMFEKFKEAMTKEFEMTDIGLMAFYLGIEVKQMEDGIFISQEGYAREILKKFKMENSQSIKTPVECGVKLSQFDEGKRIDPIFFKSLVGSLRYLTCTRPDILYAVGLVSRYMETPTVTHLKTAKRIMRYIKGTIDFGLFYSSSNNFKLVGYSDSDWAGDMDDIKSTTGFVFFIGDTAFTWMSKKQPIVTLSTCEAEYVAATSCVCHAIWLRNLLKEISLPQEEAIKICIDNKSAIALAKNPVFHDRSKHIDMRYHYIRECIERREIQVQYVKSQDQVADIFTKPLKIEDFIKMRSRRQKESATGCEGSWLAGSTTSTRPLIAENDRDIGSSREGSSGHFRSCENKGFARDAANRDIQGRIRPRPGFCEHRVTGRSLG